MKDKPIPTKPEETPRRHGRDPHPGDGWRCETLAGDEVRIVAKEPSIAAPGEPLVLRGADGELWVSLNIIGKVARYDDVHVEGMGLSQAVRQYVAETEPGTRS